MPEFRIVAAALLFVVALYWTIAAGYEIVLARKPPGIFGLSLVRPMNPEPVLTVSQWRKGVSFYLPWSSWWLAWGLACFRVGPDTRASGVVMVIVSLVHRA